MICRRCEFVKEQVSLLMVDPVFVLTRRTPTHSRGCPSRKLFSSAEGVTGVGNRWYPDTDSSELLAGVMV